MSYDRKNSKPTYQTFWAIFLFLFTRGDSGRRGRGFAFPSWDGWRRQATAFLGSEGTRRGGRGLVHLAVPGTLPGGDRDGSGGPGPGGRLEEAG
jgi:hypothetical protein